MQVLPKSLEKFLAEYTSLEAVLAQLYVNPLKYLKRTYLRLTDRSKSNH